MYDRNFYLTHVYKCSISRLPPSLYHILLLSISSFVTVCHIASSSSSAYLHHVCTPPLRVCVCVTAVTTHSACHGGEMARERLKLCLVIMKG